MAAGIGFALITGMLWGLVFIPPAILPDYPAILLVCGRYLAFGFVAAPLAFIDRYVLRRLSLNDWLYALKLAAIGNFAYYLFLASAIQRIGSPLPAIIMGSLPVVLAIASNIVNSKRDGHFPWNRLFLPLLFILAGIGSVNIDEMKNISPDGGVFDYVIGIFLALGALAAWTWYPLRNADWLRRNTEHSPRAWATAQGLMTLPLAIIGSLALWGWTDISGENLSLPFGPNPLPFILLMVAMGLLSSWIGTMCWNEASQRLPTTVAGQLIVFETIFALIYAYSWRGVFPELPTILGIAFLITGVILGVRVKPNPK